MVLEKVSGEAAESVTVPDASIVVAPAIEPAFVILPELRFLLILMVSASCLN